MRRQVGTLRYDGRQITARCDADDSAQREIAPPLFVRAPQRDHFHTPAIVSLRLLAPKLRRTIGAIATCRLHQHTGRRR